MNPQFYSRSSTSSSDDEGTKPANDANNDTNLDETDPAALLEGITAADILAAVSESADQGISMISKWLGIKLTPDANTTAPEEGSN